jgi:hypothetical protein
LSSVAHIRRTTTAPGLKLDGIRVSTTWSVDIVGNELHQPLGMYSMVKWCPLHPNVDNYEQ